MRLNPWKERVVYLHPDITPEKSSIQLASYQTVTPSRILQAVGLLGFYGCRRELPVHNIGVYGVQKCCSTAALKYHINYASMPCTGVGLINEDEREIGIFVSSQMLPGIPLRCGFED